MNVVSASDDLGENSMLTSDELNEIPLSYNVNDLPDNLEYSSNDVLKSGEGNFTELAQYLKDKTGTIELNKSYKYVEGDKVSINGTEIKNSITLNGNGNTIDASNLVRIFKVTASNVTFNNITFINSNSINNGGAVYTNITTKNIIFKDCTFKNNKAPIGGAICSRSNNTQIINCKFENNSATVNSTINYEGGGAISIDGNGTTIKNSEFINNQANTALGGAIAVHGVNLNISSSKFDNNTAHKGGAIVLHGKYAQISKSNFTNNHIEFLAKNTTLDGPMGAGIYILGDYSEIFDCEFINNSIKIQDKENHLGGGIYSYASFVKILKCNFESNYAGFGAGIYSHGQNMTIDQCNFTKNEVSDSGSAVTLKSDNTTIKNCNFKDNIAKTNGGAIYIDESEATTETYVDNCIFTSNSARNGGAIHIRTNEKNCYLTNCYFKDNAVSKVGGAVSINGNANIANSEFYGNNASSGSAIYLNNNGENKLYISNIIFGKNRADSSSLDIAIDKVESYSPSNVTINFILKGNDNIANAIWNNKPYTDVYISNITYEIYRNDKLETITTPVGYINPSNGAQSSAAVWQDEREDAQSLNVEIICDETGENILDENNNLLDKYQNLLRATNNVELTDINGNITKLLANLKAGNYTVRASHERDEYYTEISNEGHFSVYDLEISKETKDTEVYVGEKVSYNITIKNNGNLTLGKIEITENIPEGFVLIDITPDWEHDGNRFVFSGTLGSNEILVLTLTFNATKVGNNFTNTISVKTNETDAKKASSEKTIVKAYPSTVSGKDIEVNYGEPINVEISSENATEIIYEIIDKNGNVKFEGTLQPGENITDLDLPVGEYTVKLKTVVDANHTSTTNTSKIIVKPLPSTVIPTAEDITVGEVAIIDIEVGPKDATGTVNVTVAGKTYKNIPVVNGKARVKVPNLPAGNYKIDVSYSGDDVYSPSTNSTTFTVKEVESDDSNTTEVDKNIHTNKQNIKNFKAGLSMHETGNPILGLFMVLIALGLAQSRRFKK